MQDSGTAYRGSLPEGYGAIWFDAIDSTNDEAKRCANEGALPGTWYVARRQLAGRGRRGRLWVSEPGNLYASLFLKPDCPVVDAANLSFLAALAVAEMLEEIAPADVDIRLKWPNDVLLDGRKICGILLESSSLAGGSLDWLVIGIGINLVHFPDDSTYPSTSLKTACGQSPDVEAVFEILATRVAYWLSRWHNEGFDVIRSAWMERAAFIGERITISPESGAREGQFCGLSAIGALLLKMDDGTMHEVPAGDVFPCDASAGQEVD